MKYGWIIDRDELFEDPNHPSFGDNEAGIIGPRDISEELEARLKNGEGRQFKMYDDDGELYYTGRIVFNDSKLENENELGLPEEAFSPVDDYGAPNAGAVWIKYQFDGEWRTL